MKKIVCAMLSVLLVFSVFTVQARGAVKGFFTALLFYFLTPAV